MTTFQYESIPIDADKINHPDSRVNELGREGWQMVFMFADPGKQALCVMERISA